METSLHRQLKELYSEEDAQQEVALGEYRIDVVNPDVLVEIQHGSLAAIRDKIAKLLKKHQVLVVKPIVARKRIIKLRKRNGQEVSKRWSPKRGTPLNLFDELVYFTRVFPHQNLVLEVPLVEVEERRYPGHGRRRWRRRNDHLVADLKLVKLGETWRFRTAADLCQFLPAGLPDVFHTGDLSRQLNIQRWMAARIAYCMRKTGATIQVGKQGNSKLYKLNRAA